MLGGLDIIGECFIGYRRRRSSRWPALCSRRSRCSESRSGRQCFALTSVARRPHSEHAGRARHLPGAGERRVGEYLLADLRGQAQLARRRGRHGRCSDRRRRRVAATAARAQSQGSGDHRNEEKCVHGDGGHAAGEAQSQCRRGVCLTSAPRRWSFGRLDRPVAMSSRPSFASGCSSPGRPRHG